MPGIPCALRLAPGRVLTPRNVSTAIRSEKVWCTTCVSLWKIHESRCPGVFGSEPLELLRLSVSLAELTQSPLAGS